MSDVTMKDPDGGEFVVGNPEDQALLASRGYTVVDRSAPRHPEQAESSPGPATAPDVEDTSAPSASPEPVERPKATTRRTSQ
jgi:hypothetical protein